MKINYKEKYMYLLAEFENYKKRLEREKNDLIKEAKISSILPFLQIKNYLDMAKIACEKSNNIESIQIGLNMIFDKFSNIFSDIGIEKIKTIGEKFDYNLHNAIEYKSSNDVEEGIIISEISPGYKLNDYVIAPSNVIVSSGK